MTNIRFQIFTHRPPFWGLQPVKVQFKLLRGVIPERPPSAECHEFPIEDTLWNVVAKCLIPEVNSRPSIGTLLEELRAIPSEKALGKRRVIEPKLPKLTGT
jgi:hypothetical protein